MPVEAKGAPLSVRIASGNPTVRNSARKTGWRPRSSTERSAVAGQQPPAEMIGDGQRITVAAVTGFELTFEVGGPHLIRRVVCQGRAPGCVHVPAAPILAAAAVARREIALIVCARATRGSDTGAASTCQQLLGAPPVLAARGDDQRLLLGRSCGADTGAARDSDPRAPARRRRDTAPPICSPSGATRRSAHTARSSTSARSRVASTNCCRWSSVMRFHPGHPPGVNHPAGLLLTLNPVYTASSLKPQASSPKTQDPVAVPLPTSACLPVVVCRFTRPSLFHSEL